MMEPECRCHCNDGINPVFARALAESLNDMFVVHSLVFRKSATLLGFQYTRRCYVELPKIRSDNYEEKRIACFKECIKLLDDGWENEDAQKHEEKMRKMVGDVNA